MNLAAKVLLLAAAYAAMGWLGMRLAVPAGYAAAIFPAAGIALAALLTYGSRLWLGVWLGDFLLGAALAYGTRGTVTGAAAATAACIAFGATAQALLGSLLVRRWVRDPAALDEEGDIVRFLVLGGPLSCLIGPSVAVASLLVAGEIYVDGWPLTWWARWTGDVLGVLLVTPLTLCLVGQPREHWRRRSFTVAVPLAIMLAAAMAFFFQAGSWEVQRLGSQFTHRVRGLTEALRRSLAGDLELLAALARFAATLPEVRGEQLHKFLERSLTHHPGIQALEWAPRIPAAERVDFEAAMAGGGYPGFRITEQAADGRMVPAQPRDEYFPVTFIEPFLPNGRALGFDLASEAVRREAIARANVTGQPTATGPIRLVQEHIAGQFGFLVVHPVYRVVPITDPQEPRSRELLGYALAVFRIADLVESTYHAPERRDVNLKLYDDTDPVGAQLLYGTAARGTQDQDTDLERSTRIHLAGRRWTLRATPTRHYLAEYRAWGAWIASAAWPLLSGLLAAFLLALSGRAGRSETQVAHRTRELQEANRMLRDSEARFRTLADTVPVMIWLTDSDGMCTYVNRRWLEFTGRTVEQDFAHGWSEAVHFEDREACLRAFAAARAAGKGFEIEYRLRRSDGEYRWVLDRGGPRYTADGILAGYIDTAMDITERKSEEARVQHLAYHDALTGLPNRRLLLDRLGQALAQAERRRHAVAVLFADLDGFKIINDTLGHAAGDALLQQAVARLREVLREEDTVARVGGDEFLIVLPNLASGEAAAQVAQKALTALAAPFQIAEHTSQVTVSLGISLYPRDGAGPETLVRHADLALYRAKAEGRNTYRFFDRALDA